MTAVRISDKLRAALELHHVQGKSLSAAAKEAGLSREGFRKALARPAVKDLAQQLQERRVADLARRQDHLRADALDELERLMRDAKSENVRLRAAEILAQIPRAPSVAVQINNGTQMPRGGGYVYRRPENFVPGVGIVNPPKESDEGEGP